MGRISYKPKEIEKGIRLPLQKDEASRIKPHSGFYRQGKNGLFVIAIPNPFPRCADGVKIEIHILKHISSEQRPARPRRSFCCRWLGPDR